MKVLNFYRWILWYRYHARTIAYSFKEALDRFWIKNPALIAGLSLLLGTAFVFDPCPIYLILLTLFLVPFCVPPVRSGRIITTLLIFTASALAAFVRSPQFEMPQQKMTGSGIFTISHLKHQHSPFQRSLLYRGTLDFQSEEFTAQNLPCQIYLPASHKRPPANAAYTIEGTLTQKSNRFFVFKPHKKSPWTPIPRTWSFAEWRYLAKQSVYAYLKRHIANHDARIFLNALATGEIDDRALSLQFGRLGLQHILAISGFHFSLIALFFGIILRAILPYRIALSTLIALLTAYYLFLGHSPSVERAWIALLIYLIGKLFSLRCSALNAIGVGLWIGWAFDPSIIVHLGFQLSFLCTLAILLLYPITENWCSRILPKRSLSETRQMPLLDQHGAILSALIRKALSLTLAIHLATLPVLLLIFHRFAWLGILYNFFFPFWVSLSLILLCSALLFTPIPFLSTLLHQANNAWTSTALQISSNPPAVLDFVLRTRSIPYEAVLLFLFLLFGFAIYHQNKPIQS